MDAQTQMQQTPSFRNCLAFLSNFHPCSAFGYPSAEHAFVASKTTDRELRKRVRACATAAEAKRFGKTLIPRPDWEERKAGFMLEILREKFRDSLLGAQLLTTGELEIVERNCWHDRTWGVCTCDRCGSRGQNLLGKLLEQVRSELRRGLLEAR